MNKPRPLTLGHAALLLLMAAAVIFYHVRDRDRLRVEPTEKELAAALGGTAAAPVTAGPLKYWLRAGSGETAATVSALAPPAVKGYVDQISALVTIDRTGKIVSVLILDQRETPSYFDRVLSADLPGQFAGRTPAEAATIDTVTSATISSRALIDDTAAAADALGAAAFGLPRRLPAPGRSALADWRLWCLWAGLAVALAAHFLRLPPRLRPAPRALVVALIGFAALSPYTLAHSFQLLRFDLPGADNLIFLSLAVFVFATTLAFGPLWCAHACPFGALQELLALLPVKKWSVTPRLMGRARELRWLTLKAATVAAFGFGVTAAGEVEPFYHLFGRSGAGVWAWALVVAALIFSAFVRRFWCRFFCPTGLCLILLSSHRRWWKPAERGVADAGIDRPDPDPELKETADGI